MSSLIQIVIQGQIKQWIKPEYFDLNQVEIKEKTNDNLYAYFLASKDTNYQWEQEHQGGLLEIYEESPAHKTGRKKIKEINY